MYPKIVLFLLLPIFAFSQAPQKINFQSILRNSSGEVVANKSVSLKISILSGSISGLTVYSETHTKTTDVSGLISLQIGNGTVLSGVFANIAWGNASHFIKLEVDFNGGSNFVVLGTQELMSVPYALYASKTDTSSLNLTNRLGEKVNISDTSNMLLKYRLGLNNKVNISDTSSMLNPYLRKADAIGSVETDPVFNASIAKGITGIDTAYWNRKLNLSDTSNMLSNYRIGLNNKVNVSDTSNMLSNYRAGLNNKVNVSDTSSMLNPYLRKSDSIIADLQNQDKLLQSFSNVVDIDGNSYKTVKIGSQIWMSENLKTSRYRNGDVIPVVTDNTAWSGLTTGARCWYDNDSTLYEYPYGNLYNWYAASDNRNICPTGWHVPSDGEYETLFNYLGGRSVAGGKMISTSSYWSVSQIKVATNESGFSALPGGYRYKPGNFYNIGGTAFFWSASEYYFNRAWFYYLDISSSNLNIDIVDRSHGYSVRCLRDPDIDINQSLNIKVNIADTSDMLNPYLRKADVIGSVETDPVFNTSVAKGITGIDTAYWNRKLNLSDTSNMLSNYRTGLNNKVNIADTASMLANYKTIITDLQKQVELLSSYTSLLASGLVDIDGNNYPVVKIGNQIWMKENLRVSRYRNGDIIPIVNFGSSDYITTGTRTWYNNDSTTYEIPYGNLYDGYAAFDIRNICPTGWHVPSDSEWTVLTDYLGGESVAGGKMKVTGTTYWNSPNAGATNESGFSALPGGGVNFGSDFVLGDLAYFYSSTKAASIQEDFVWIRFLYSFNDDIDRNFNGINTRASIRCLRD